MDGKLTRKYKVFLFIAQFILKADDLKVVLKSLPQILTRLGLNNEEKRLKIIEGVKAIINDFRKVQASKENGNIYLLARTSRNFIRSSIALFSVLLTLTSIKNSLINIVSKKELGGSVPPRSLKDLGLTTVSLASLLTSVPLTESVISKLAPFVKHKKLMSTFLVAFGFGCAYPKENYRDAMSIYMFIYGAEYWLNYLHGNGYLKIKHKNKFLEMLNRRWLLIPITMCELYHTYIIDPKFTPSLVKKIFDSMLKDIYDSKPIWYEGDWPSVTETTSLIRESTILKNREFKTNLLYSGMKHIKSYQPSPLHTNKVLSFTNPTEPNMLKIILKFIPSKYLKLMLILTPLYFAKGLITKEISLNSPKDKWMLYTTELLKKVSKLSAFAILSTITIHFLTVKNINTRSPIKHYRLIGAIGGLWGLLYRDSANAGVLSYVVRITALSLWRRQAMKYRILEKWKLDVIINAFGITMLVGLHDVGLDEYLPKNFVNFAKLISNGGNIL